jgi:hypothetical protein
MGKGRERGAGWSESGATFMDIKKMASSIGEGDQELEKRLAQEELT